jgi:Putative zinc-finger
MSRDCSRAEGLVEKLFDGEASSAERREAEAHLENCAACRSHLEFLASMAERARDRTPPEPPEAYWEHLPRRILGRIEEEGSPSRGWLRKLFPGGLRWVAPAVALFASLIVVVAVGTRFLRDSPGMEMSEPNARTEPRAPAEGLPASPMSREREEEQPSALAESPSSSPSPSPSPSASAAPSVSAPNERSEKAPPMARDEKPAASPAQSSEDAEVRDAALGRMKDKASPSGEARPAAAPAAESPAAIASASTRQGGPASSALSVRERKEANTPAREPQADSIALSQAGSFGEGDCSALRDALSTWHREADEDEGANETRKRDVQYQLARCSLDRYRREGGEALRKAAIDDGDAFLASEKEGPRPEEIRADVERLRPSEKEN